MSEISPEARDATQDVCNHLYAQLVEAASTKGREMIAEAMQLACERHTARVTTEKDCVYWSARDASGEMQHYRSDAEHAGKLLTEKDAEIVRLRDAVELAHEDALAIENYKRAEYYRTTLSPIP